MKSSFKSASPAAYADVKYVMEMAVNKPGLQYHLSSLGATINFKQRCNRYRNLLREQAAELTANIPGYRPETAFDMLVIRQVNAEGKPDKRGCILIFDHHVPEGRLIDPETGEEISLPNLPTIIGDPQ